MLHREKTEELVDLAFQAIREILADPKTAPSIRLKAALAIIQTASTPPEPKRQVTLDIEKIHVIKHTEPTILTEDPNGRFVHKDAQSASAPKPVSATPPPQNAHKNAQTDGRPVAAQPASQKPGRNELCPCGSNKKFKRCCIDKPLAAAA